MSVELGPLPFNEVQNGARILLLLRRVKTWRDLCACFDYTDPSNMGNTATMTLYDQLATLRKLGFVEFDADTAKRGAIDGEIAVSMHWTEVQNALGHQSLRGIADISSSASGVVVHPVFGRPAKPEHPAQVFMLMPFKTELKGIYENHIKALAKELEITVVRADEKYALGKAFINKVWDGIFGAELIIADCTEKNANVFYEIGVAHVVGKPIVLITRSHDDIPSDIKHLDYIIYDTPQGVEILLEKLSEVLQRMLRPK
jgi:hypothetical protein